MADYRDPPKELSLPTRLPLFGILDNRAENPDLDARIINGFVERSPSGSVRLLKRSGMHRLVQNTQENATGAGIINGYVCWYDTENAPGDRIRLYSLDAETDELTLIGSVTSSLDGTLEKFVWMEKVPVGSTEEILLALNTRAARTYDPIGLRDIFRAGTTAVITCATTNASPVVTHSSNIPAAYFLVTGAGIPANTTILTIDSATQFTLSSNATATNAAVSLTLEAEAPSTAYQINNEYSDDYTAPITDYIGGIVVLNKAVYLGMGNGRIYGSDADAPRDWSPLNFIAPYAERGGLLFISRQHSHLIAFKQYSVEFFRDAGLSDGSPLERVEGLQLDVGVLNKRVVQVFAQTLVWMSNNREGERSVYLLQGLRAKEIAGPAERRILSLGSDWFTLGLILAGHSFFVLTSVERAVSLVYDLDSELWYYWNALGETYFPFAAATPAFYDRHVGGVFLQHLTDGWIYSMEDDEILDAGEPVVMEIYPPEFDGGMRVAKYLSKMYIVADQQDGSRLKIRVNDHNRAPEYWSNWREFDLGKSRPRLDECGSFYKRAFHFRHDSPTRCRLEFVELDIQAGVL